MNLLSYIIIGTTIIYCAVIVYLSTKKEYTKQTVGKEKDNGCSNIMDSYAVSYARINTLDIQDQPYYQTYG